MASNAPNTTPWPYIDSPWDLLVDCEEVEQNEQDASVIMCNMSSVMGIFSAFILPIVCVISIFGNMIIAYVFLIRMTKPFRQLIYLGWLACVDTATIVIFGMLWIFPAKGLPYMTYGKVYFFTFYQSPAMCRLHRFAYSFTSALSSSILVVTALDRCLSIYFPIQFSKISHKRAWFVMIGLAIGSALMMLPYGIVVNWSLSHGLITCWVPAGDEFWPIYHVLFANSSLVQTLLMVIINLALTVRLYRLSSKRQELIKTKGHQKEVAASLLLLIISAMAAVAALPQCIAYLAADILQRIHKEDEVRGPVRLAYNICDLGWHFLFIQQASNFFIYLWRMQTFRTNLKEMFGIKIEKISILARQTVITKQKLSNALASSIGSYLNHAKSAQPNQGPQILDPEKAVTLCAVHQILRNTSMVNGKATMNSDKKYLFPSRMRNSSADYQCEF